MKNLLHYLFSVTFALLLSIGAFTQDIPDTLSTFYGKGMDVFVDNSNKSGGTYYDVNYNNISWSTYNAILTLRVYDYDDAIRVRIPYLRYDLSYISSITDAFIGLNTVYNQSWIDSTSAKASVYGVTDQSLDHWGDTALTFNTAPGLYEAEDDILFEVNKKEAELLTTITFYKDSLGWVYSKPSQEMDDFIAADTNDLVTFFILFEEPMKTDEIRFSSKEDTVGAPILHGANILTKADDVKSTLQSDVSLQSYPNPFNGATTLKYELSNPQNVELTIYNALGSKVTTLVNEYQAANEYTVDVDMTGMQLSTGIYYAKITMGAESQTIKLVNCK